jgi:acyl dehydratase
MALRYLEDYTPGLSAEFGEIKVDEDAILAFAHRYDPQPFHTDPEAAKNSPYGGLIASGWHTSALVMRAVVDHFVDAETSLGSPGLGPIRWLLPVRPGDTLRVRASVLDAWHSQSKPDRGTVTFDVDVINQDGAIVMRIENWLAIIKARPERR